MKSRLEIIEDTIYDMDRVYHVLVQLLDALQEEKGSGEILQHARMSKYYLDEARKELIALHFRTDAEERVDPVK